MKEMETMYDPEDDYDDEERYADSALCPCCEGLLKKQNYYDDGHLVESFSSCSCGYSYGTSYGGTFLDLPDGWVEYNDRIMTQEDYDELMKEKEEEEEE